VGVFARSPGGRFSGVRCPECRRTVYVSWRSYARIGSGRGSGERRRLGQRLWWGVWRDRAVRAPEEQRLRRARAL